MISQVFPYLSAEKHIELNNGNKILVQKTKQEPMFSSFNDSESSSKKIVVEISESPVLRQILFLKSTPPPNDSPTSISIEYPFCLDPDFDFKTRLRDRRNYSDTNEKLDELIEKRREIVVNVLKDVVADSLESFMSDPELTRILKSRHQDTYDIIENMKKTINKNPKISNDHASRTIALLNSMYELQGLTKIKDYVEISENAHSNSKSINQSIKLPDKKQEIIDAFSRLTKHPITLNMETLCLDCYFTDNKAPYYSQTINAKTIHLPDVCERCNGKGLVHKIFIGYPASISKLLMPENHWLQEIIMAYAMSDLDSIKEIYIHKKIHAIADGQIQQGIESDITIITKDNRLILGEVTTQSSTDNILNDITRKAKNLENAKIPYDKMIYFTSHDQENFITVDTVKTRIFGLRHLYNIKDFVKNWIEPEHMEKPAPKVS